MANGMMNDPMAMGQWMMGPAETSAPVTKHKDPRPPRDPAPPPPPPRQKED